MNKTPTPLDLHLLHQIVEYAGSAHTIEQLMDRLVERIRLVLDVDVCNLYHADASGTLHLVSSSSLHAMSLPAVSLQPGEGLTGFAAASQIPVSRAVAPEDPRFVFIDGFDDTLKAYLAVPIVYLGTTVGVIVVRDTREREFAAEEISFLITMAAQLSGSLIRLPLTRVAPRSSGERQINGQGAAPGKAIGQLHLVVDHQLLKLMDAPESNGLEQEHESLDRAIAMVITDIRRSRNHLAESAPAEVLSLFDFYQDLLEGDLAHLTRAGIAAGMSAFAAVRETTDKHVAAFETISDTYLRARGEDVRVLGDKLLNALLYEDNAPTADENVVLFGELVSITDIGKFNPEQVLGIVSMQGAALSHTAVVARALGIPAVVSVGPVDHIREGEAVIVDGDGGFIILQAGAALQQAYRKTIVSDRRQEQVWLQEKDLPGITRDGQRIQLLANTGLLTGVRPGLDRGAEGIGLFRSELPFLMRDTLPSEDEQYAIYQEILGLYAPLPVTLRLLDVGGDKQLPYLPIEETNPELGWRGVRFLLDNRPILVTQLRAMLRAHLNHTNARILLPMADNVDDAVTIKLLLEEIWHEVAGPHSLAQPEFGLMVEVPGIIALLPHLSDVIDFVSIGTNDLTQYILAVDRGNQRVAARYDSLHPGVLQSIHTTLKTCKALNLPVSVCGEMASDPVAAVLLIGMGATSLSMSAANLPRIRHLVRYVAVSECARLCAQVEEMHDSQAIRLLAQQAVMSWDPVVLTSHTTV